MELNAKREQLLQILSQTESCAVAFSGGVDSAVVAKAAQLALGERAVAVTAVSPSLASGELELARDVASAVGIRHIEVATDEISDPKYVRNHQDRCFYCKSELYSVMTKHLADWDVSVIVNGANVDDQDDYRPGMRAAQDAAVRSPLIEAGIVKSEVRELARLWELQVADKPAMPCLSSRIAYGEEVTPERLRRVDQAESWLREQGFSDTRVRHHAGDLARIELQPDQLPRMLEASLNRELTEAFRAFGFKFVTVDLEGRRTGSLNTLIQIEVPNL